MNKQLFQSLEIPPKMVKNLSELGFVQMTDVQAQSIPFSLLDEDLTVQAKTGSGKTVAFGIPLLLKIDVKNFRPQALVLAPTRELAMQVARELRKLARFVPNVKIVTLCGGMPMRAEMNSLSHGAHIVVATAGRVLDHIGKKTLYLDSIKIAVLDEADRMLDMGFLDDIQKILLFTPKNRQTLLFSATYPDSVIGLGKNILKSYREIRVKSDIDTTNIEEMSFYTKDKREDLLKILSYFKPQTAIVFVQTKLKVEELTTFLQSRGFCAIGLQGNMKQIDRNETLLMFENRSKRILVATDLASRGLDIEGVDMIVNFDMPESEENHIHRIGRTARAGREGLAVNMVNKNLKNTSCIKDLKIEKTDILKASMKTLKILGGKKNRLRAGDILGALVKDVEIENDKIGKIDIVDTVTYVAIDKKFFDQALKGLRSVKIKGKKFKILDLS